MFSDRVLVEANIDPGLRNWQFTEVLSGLDEGAVIASARDSTEIKPGALAEAK